MIRLRARYVFPVTAPPIEDGCVAIDAGRIVEIAPFAGQSDAEDLGHVAIVPGFVNAHTHLELSHHGAPVGHPGIGLAEWIRLLMAEPRDAQGKTRAVCAGLDECRREGVTAVGDIASLPWPKDVDHQVAAAVFFEIIAPTPDGVQPAMQQAIEFLTHARPASDVNVGVSLHAPYTVRPEAWLLAVQAAQQLNVPLAVHVAESREEIEFLKTAGGPLRRLLDERQAWSDGLVSPPGRPLDYLRLLADAPRVLVAHGNYLDDEEIAFLAGRRHRMSVVYCPRTHAFFRHDPYSLSAMLRAGVNVAVGTDSRASSPDLSMLAELRHLAARHPEVPPAVVLELGTLGGARAMGIDDQVGSIEPGKRADLAVVALPESTTGDAHEQLLDPAAHVVNRYLGGA